ncbi:RdgB/HAM1 family non-canonical purine NTP pyrophosphatase [Tropicimonas sp. S265A]|uniref:RdgB/HAM1 family non-canonical purine NTP pyrophosphatase n=1 Tax=Tropicimonas sp. S265A TaxID=3415134 RepID=UPI003C7CCBE3
MRTFSGSEILVASHNTGKIEEIAHLLEPFGIKVRAASEFGLDEPEETETTFVGNARIKAHFAAKETGLPALADDSGLSVAALNGDPGVYTADWAETGDGRDFDMAMRKVNDALQATGAAEPWVAKFCCTLVLAWPDGHDEVFPGEIVGRLTWPPRGDQGHGYDPVFIPDGHDITFGEMDRWEKNKMSHRADAFAKLTQAFEG